MDINAWLELPEHHTVIINDSATITVKELTRRVACVQAELMSNQVKSCALYCSDTSLFLSVFLACACSGVDIVLPANTTAEFIKNLDVDWLVGDFADSQTFDFDASKNSYPEIMSVNSKVVVYTSGSTGAPKRIPRDIRQLTIEVEALQLTWGGQFEQAIFVSTVSHQHIYGLLFKLLWPLLSGQMLWHKIVPFEESLDELMLRFKSIVLVSSPAFLKRINDVHSIDGTHLTIFSSGGVLTNEKQKQAENKLLAKIVQVYGSSETGGIAHRVLDKSWQLLKSVDYRIQDQVLWVKSPYCYVNEWLCTHDRVELIDSGFELRGREDHIVKIEEKRISLMQVEQQLIQSSLIDDVVVFSMENNRQFLAALIQLNAQGQCLLESNGRLRLKNKIKQELQHKLEVLAIPRQIRFTDKPLENSQGKRVRADLLMRFYEIS